MARVAVNDPSASFGELLRDHRRAAGLTQEELAERAGISPRSISGLEAGGAHIPRRDTVALLVRALGLSGADRDAFEAIVDRRRGPRASPSVELVPGQPMASVAERVVHNVPRSLTSFIGREQELNELARLLPTTPLLTLVGAGGVGKTRLAQELVRYQLTTFVDGCWFVELSGLADPSLVPGAVAAAIGLRDVQSRNMTDSLAAYLESKQLLLVLDNCEHLVEASATLVARLLGECPFIQVLATSREPLAISGEMTWRVAPLDLPDPKSPLSSEQITRSAAVRLFVERAQALNNTLVLTEDNAAAIARICIGVDGIPLALELAAARARVLTVDQLAERLEHDSSVLRRADRAGLPQHRTIRATIDWSHDLLTDLERLLLRRLSVFAGGWTLPSAEKVCSGDDIEPDAVLDLLTQLVDKSMVVMDVEQSSARYRLLEPIRQYALERLDASNEAALCRARHATAFLQMARPGEVGIAGPDEVASLDRFEVEHANLRVALRWALTHQHVQAALRAASALFRFWERRGHFQEGCSWLEQALAATDETPSPERGRALNALAFLYWRGGDARRADPIAEQAFAVCQQAGTVRDVAQALVNLGMIAYFRGRPALAAARLEEAVLFGRQAADIPQLSVALTFLGRTLLWAKGPNNTRAAAVLEESLALAESARSLYATGHALLTLGDLVWRRAEFERAGSLWRRALAIRAQLADRRGIAGSLERLAWGLVVGEDYAAAAWLFGAAEAQRTAVGIGLRHDEQIDHAHQVTVVREHLGDATSAAWAAGRVASVDEAVRHALAATTSNVAVPR
jgi:predicted ATPase/DNA-binding XRE family transcriptional regulator